MWHAILAKSPLLFTLGLLVGVLSPAAGIVDQPLADAAPPAVHDVAAVETEWVRLYGSSAEDEATDIDRYRDDAIYVTGCTKGNLGGHTNAGGKDAFLACFDAGGNMEWVRLLGSAADDCANGVAVEQGAPPYRIYFTGYTKGNLAGVTNSGEEDIFVASVLNDGTPQFVTVFGTDAHDEGFDIDKSDNVVVVGRTWGPSLDGTANDGGQAYLRNQVGFMALFDDVDGFVESVSLFGGPMTDVATGVVQKHDGGIYITGYTGGEMERQSVPAGIDGMKGFLTKYDVHGERQWLRYFGTEEEDKPLAIALRADGMAAITGYSQGDLAGEENAGWDSRHADVGDAFLRIDEVTWNFGLQWSRLIGSPAGETGLDVATDLSGMKTWVTGHTRGDLQGENNAGYEDVFLARYHAPGPGWWDWTKLLGTSTSERGTGVHVMPYFSLESFRVREIFVTGYSWGNLGGRSNNGQSDIFLWKLRENRPGTPDDLVQGDFDDGQAEGWVDDGSGTWQVKTAGSYLEAVGASRLFEHGDQLNQDEVLANGVYEMAGNRDNKHRFSHHAVRACDFSFEADVRKVAGDAGDVLYPGGIVFRSDVAPGQRVPRNYYQFVAVRDGQYMMGKRVNAGAFEQLVEWRHAGAFRTGYGAWNTLKVVAEGNRIRLYANDQLLSTVRDGSFDCGYVGVFAIDAGSSDPADTVQFDNVHLYVPPLLERPPFNPSNWVHLPFSER